MQAVLALEDGSYVVGEGFGSPGRAQGEVVFTTSMVGYVESLTDPSYAGQILLFTYPLIGNYGVSPEDFESDGIKVEGLVIRELCEHPSNWRSGIKHLNSLLEDEGIPGIQGVDTRYLTRKIRMHGTLRGILEVNPSGEIDIQELIDQARKIPYIWELDLVERVGTKSIYRIQAGGKHDLAVIDCGIKRSILRCLLSRNLNLIIFPYNTPANIILDYDPAGLLISNGPGDPARVVPTRDTIRKLIKSLVTYGICLGHQLIGLSLGAKTFKLKFGHRGINHPVRDLDSGKVMITSQNHGFAIDISSLNSTGLIPTQISLYDGTLEGMAHRELPVRSVQYHPEASPGPHDSLNWFFDDLLAKLEEYA